jgi:PIN domain nuclease of toxin-antitoxin system
MRLLLDTNTFLWWLDTKERLSDRALQACEQVENSIHLSLASVWELQLKINLGKLEIIGSLADAIAKQRDQGLQLLDIRPEHVYATFSLPLIHGDPFDRLLVAQTLTENMTLVTADRKLVEYPVPVLW